tara:strand:+ start:60 stop:224 length:165 start_codon:yes stop_codon:yes gene_type:complete
VQVVSALLAEGPKALARITEEMARRLSGMGYDSLAEARGVLSMENARTLKSGSG